MGEQQMNNNQVKSANTGLLNVLSIQGEANGKTTFNRKPDLTYDLERVLAKLNIEIEVLTNTID